MSRFGAFPRTPALRSGCSGAMLFGGRKESSPQLRAPPRAFGVRPRTTPLPRFQDSVRGVASASDFFIARLRRRSSKGVDALAEMSEARSRMCLPHPPCARTSRPRRAEGIVGRDSLKHKTPCGVLLEGVPSNRLCACNSVVSESRVSYQARRLYLHRQRFPSTHYLRRRPRPCFWDSALAATDFTRADECPLRRRLLAFVATRRLVGFLCAIINVSFQVYRTSWDNRHPYCGCSPTGA